MVDIFPFRALRYNPDRLKAQGATLNDVVTPPYDVIDAAAQQAFYDRHPANFIRLDLGQKTDQDNAHDNVYTRAARHIQDWQADGTLMAEAQPAIYAYSQTWTENGETIERKGAIMLLRLEAFETGNVLPHEHTLKGPKADRLQLMQQTLCGLSQVFMIYSDPDRLLEGLLYEQPAAHHGWAQAEDPMGAVTHRFRPVTDPEIIARLQTMFRDKTLLIADGHHRYETALGFAQDARAHIKRLTGQEPPPGSLLSDYGMIFVTNMDDPGLQVYPTHRVLTGWPAGWDRPRFEAALLQQYERVETNPTFVYQAPGQADQPLRLKASVDPGLPPLLDTFDAALLEQTVFQGVLHQSGEELKKAHLLDFIRDEDAVDAALASGEAQAVFRLAAPSVKLVHQICESGHRMPQKSTYFYPKILSGLLMLPFCPLPDGGHALSGVAPAQPLPADLRFPEMVFSQRPY